MPCIRTLADLHPLAPGVYDCPQHHCHILIHELLEANGYEPNEANIETFIAALKQQYPAETVFHLPVD